MADNLKKSAWFKNSCCSILKDGARFIFKKNLVHEKLVFPEKNVLGNVVELLLDKDNRGGAEIYFKKVETLRDFIKRGNIGYDHALKCVDSMLRQYHVLSKIGHVIGDLSSDSILVFDEETFLYVGKRDSDADLREIKDGMVSCLAGDKIKYALEETCAGGDRVDMHACHYILGEVIVEVVFGKYTENLLPIINTKMYFFIKRCFDPDPELRVLIWV